MPIHNTSHGNRPTVRPKLLLDFANSKDLDPRVIFSRHSSATYYDGKSNVKAEENLFIYSQEVASWPRGSGSTITSNTASAPDGTTTADRILAAANWYGAYRVSLQAGQQYTLSVYVKSNTASNQNFVLFRENSIYVATETATTSWQRFTYTFTVNSSTASDYGLWNTGNGIGNDLLVWGMQLEQRSLATSYIATTSVPIVKYQPKLQTAITNEPRFDHDPVTGESKGLLIEESRTNLDTSSDTINFLYNTTSNNNYGIAPDGTQSADLGAYQSNGAAIGLFNGNKPTSSGAYTWSVFVKKFGDINVIRVYDNNASVYADFNIDIGTVVGGNASRRDIIDVGNGWYRVWMSSNVSINTTYFQIYGYDSIGSVFNTINNYNGIFVWGSQVEQGSFPTSYIPTYGQSIARNEERAYVNVESILDVHNGTIYAESISGPIGWDVSGQYNVFHYGNSNDDGYGVFKESGSGDFWFHLRKNNTSLFNVSNGSQWNSNTLSKVVISFDPSTQNYFVDGTQVGGDQTTSLYQLDSSDITELQIGFTGNSGYFNGHIKKIAAYNTKLPNAALQAMTEE